MLLGGVIDLASFITTDNQFLPKTETEPYFPHASFAPLRPSLLLRMT